MGKIRMLLEFLGWDSVGDAEEGEKEKGKKVGLERARGKERDRDRERGRERERARERGREWERGKMMERERLVGRMMGIRVGMDKGRNGVYR